MTQPTAVQEVEAEVVLETDQEWKILSFLQKRIYQEQYPTLQIS